VHSAGIVVGVGALVVLKLDVGVAPVWGSPSTEEMLPRLVPYPGTPFLTRM